MQSELPPEMSLIGRSFIIWGDDGSWNYQGVVRGSPEPGVYLVQFFSASDGSPTTFALFRIDAMMGKNWQKPDTFLFFGNDEDLRFWIEHKAPPRNSPKTENTQQNMQLMQFIKTNPNASLSEIAAAFFTNKSKAERWIRALISEKWIRRDELSGKLSLTTDARNYLDEAKLGA